MLLAPDTAAGLRDVPVLMRRHAANYAFFFDVNGDGDDIRFIAADDQTRLKFHLEKFAIANEMALIRGATTLAGTQSAVVSRM